MKRHILILFFITGFFLFVFYLEGLAADTQEKMDILAQFQQFLKEFEAKVIPLSQKTAIASFNASISGDEKDYALSADLQIQLEKIYSDHQDILQLKKWKQSGVFEDPLLQRQLDVLYYAYLGNQIEEKKLEELVRKQTDIERKFNTFRPKLSGNILTDNQLEQILRNSTDQLELEEVWKASKKIGREVSDDIIQLVKLRNLTARELGFANFHQMQLVLNEQDPEEIDRLFNKLDLLTGDPFRKAKLEIDTFLASRLGIEKDALMPWHYQNRFFQEAPRIYSVDFDSYYKDKDLVSIARDYYAGIGLPVDDIIARSDLFEKPGKYQHAFSTDIDRRGDVRVLSSVQPNYLWMNTLLHEFGHAVYSKYNDLDVPWVLRDAAHAFTTEAIANLFGRFAANPGWLRDVLGISPEEKEKIARASFNSQRLEQLVFSRWSQVMYHFEKSLYQNPDQDLNKLWWDLAERYQFIKPPDGRDEPDWAAKIHVALYPAYYHNYLLGELLASQFYFHISEKILRSQGISNESFFKREEVGQYLIKTVFKPGMTLHWNDMIEKACGERLNPVYYVRQFVTGN